MEIFESQTNFYDSAPVRRIHIILIWIQIQIQDVKKFVTDPDPDPGRTLIRIRILAKTIRIQQKGLSIRKFFEM